MDIQVLASGSSGNCYKISDGKTAILLDAGIPIRAIQIKCNFHLNDIAACLISHCHKDHSAAANDLAKFGIDIFASQGTITECGFVGHRIRPVKALSLFRIGTFKIIGFDTQHDTPEPLGFLVESTVTNEKLLYFTDSFYIKYKFQGLTHIMAECNYDKETFQASIHNGRINKELAPRLIKSHMSLEHLIELLNANDLKKVKQIYLMHLSDNNANERLIKEEIQKLTGTEVYIC